ncbi:GNAT family N-acetyltransferase [Flexivirga alba]|uniref:GNAT family N-acetyltransferase n=1 Tax=Flexivirga alba TaxID=702742 RepID=A0ABW2AB70_9MICO
MAEVETARAEHVTSWLSLAEEVTPLFGPMPDFEQHVRRGIARGTAFVVTHGSVVTGGMLLSRDDKAHHINWLAVRHSARRQGIGAALVRTALERWPEGDVGVVTFSREVDGGDPARSLYRGLGFVDHGATGLAPDGSPRDLFTLER